MYFDTSLNKGFPVLFYYLASQAQQGQSCLNDGARYLSEQMISVFPPAHPQQPDQESRCLKFHSQRSPGRTFSPSGHASAGPGSASASDLRQRLRLETLSCHHPFLFVATTRRGLKLGKAVWRSSFRTRLYQQTTGLLSHHIFHTSRFPGPYTMATHTTSLPVMSMVMTGQSQSRQS